MNQPISPYVYPVLTMYAKRKFKNSIHDDSIDNIIKTVAQRLNIPIEKIKAYHPKRVPDNLADACRIATVLIRKQSPEMGLKLLGSYLRDGEPLHHSSVLYRIERHNELLFSDSKYRLKCKLFGIV